MEENIIFKSSAFGFDKKEVINYISEISAKNAEKTAAIEQLSHENSVLVSEAETLRSENIRLSEEKTALNKVVEELTATIASLNSHIEELNKKAEKIDDIEGAEEKANRLMMDSLRYSESCIQNARRVSASINMSTKTKIDKAKDSLDSVSGDFKNLTEQIEVSIATISDRLARLSSGFDEEN